MHSWSKNDACTFSLPQQSSSAMLLGFILVDSAIFSWNDFKTPFTENVLCSAHSFSQNLWAFSALFSRNCERLSNLLSQNLWAFVALFHTEFVSVRFTVIFYSFSRNLWAYYSLLFTELKCFHTADICLNHNMILLCMGGRGGGGAEIKFYHWSAIRFWSEQVHLDWRIMIVYDKVLLILRSWWCKH